MAVEKSKMLFLALAFACLLQNTASAPRASSPKSSVPPELEIVGRAVSEIAQSFSEFLKSIGSILAHSVAEAIVKFGVPLYLKVHVIFSATGMQDASLTFTAEQHLEYRVVANTMLQLRQRLDVMERFEETYDSILAELAASTLSNPSIKDTKSAPEFLSKLIWAFTETADKRLKQSAELKDCYQQVRTKVQAEEAKVTPTVLDFSKMSQSMQQLEQILPQSVKTKLLTFFLGKQFLHHTLNRVTIIKKEYFVMARSTLELSKKSNKLESVQQVYDKAISVASSLLDALKVDSVDLSKGLFSELKSNFEANQSLNQEWREMQKSVSQRHDWDRSIWDLDLAPF